MNKTSLYIASAFTALLATMAVTSCNSDDEPVRTPLASPVVTVEQITTHSVSLTWQAVNGARQYGYRLVSNDGTEAEAGVTTQTSLEMTDIEHNTNYTFMLTAFPYDNTALQSEYTKTEVYTPFCAQVINQEGSYSSTLVGDLWTARMDEDRSAADYKENTLGVFTILRFYDRSPSIVFTVNDDKTITIQNAAGRDDNGWAKLPTGRPQATLRNIYINESSSVFDCANHKLTYKARTDSLAAVTETFTW